MEMIYEIDTSNPSRLDENVSEVVSSVFENLKEIGDLDKTLSYICHKYGSRDDDGMR
jgi:hypothetical protein